MGTNCRARAGGIVDDSRVSHTARQYQSIQGVIAVKPLPSKELVLHACRAVPRHEHPLLASAHLLAGLHERRLLAEPGGTSTIDQHRARLVLSIDRWVATELPLPHGGAHMHTETVGMVIDRLAQFSASAHEMLPAAPEWAVHDSWERLAELALGYEDLAYEVAARVRRLPYLSGPRSAS
ncbi:DUF4254 domain-containing protein [Nocardia sp. NBC_00508]|uniref:DUF4254 domain-containing protein n=1 Tax=Nocardia sp. NBC_00508 TaxID=2975992 RepID=UPI002E81D63B|nr:DUF4254 domain-containing protein [Nocardia sp. NBC_00508]WUD68987.1 DUF4254 domain-containing protein [Nocardia sp. NBC_00508]